MSCEIPSTPLGTLKGYTCQNGSGLLEIEVTYLVQRSHPKLSLTRTRTLTQEAQQALYGTHGHV